MSNTPSLHTDVLVVGQQTILPAQYCSASGAAAFGGISLLSGPIFCGTPTPVQFSASAASAIVNVVPSTSVPGGNALNISSDGLGLTPYPGNGLAVNALQHLITCNLTSGITMNSASITILTPTFNFYANEIHVGSVSQSGAKAESGAKADVGARVEASVAAQNANVSVAANLDVGAKINCAWLEGELAQAKASPPKGFDMHHPTKPGWRLTHICLEGPEAAVYYRGRLKDSNYIDLPEYWKGLVDVETITVHLTPHGNYQELYYEVSDWGTKIKVLNNASSSVDCSYVVYGERKDVDKIVVEYEGKIEDYPGRDQRSIVGYHYDYRPGVNS